MLHPTNAFVVLSAVALSVLACSGGGSETIGSGGRAASGGTASSGGGHGNGGNSNGGSASGGRANGGSLNGGSANGGSANGGNANGGNANGGRGNGGSPNGGSANGGAGGAACPNLAGNWTVKMHCQSAQVGKTVAVTQTGCMATVPSFNFSGTVGTNGQLNLSGGGITCTGTATASLITEQCMVLGQPCAVSLTR